MKTNCRNCHKPLGSIPWCAPCGLMHLPEGTPWPVAKPSKTRGRKGKKKVTRKRATK